ncbi:MAG TPA: MerR family DNA-binding transcriptional regulator [Planctomycetota bacterium]|jgi:DNA-binding transcriptional MerR regulator|nr:MerR family DNA-binding transcriptional regulator [Planctomycetota bacterium]
MTPKKLFKIGEVMKYSGLSRQTIHNYTMMGLITEDERTPSGHRLYGEGVFTRIEKIKMLLRHRSLSEVLKLMKQEDAEAPKPQ